jgi:hypothetical protein
MTTATIASSHVNAFAAFVATKNKKAIKLGCPEIKYDVSAPFIKTIEHVEYEFVTVTIDESIIKVGNYSVIGRIDEVEGSVIPSGFSDMKKYRNVSMTECDHCNVSRVRKHLVIVSDGTNEMKIGSTCLNDFVGHASALSFIASIGWVMNLQDTVDEEGFGRVSSSAAVYPIKEVLSYGAAVVRMDGRYISKKTAEENGSFWTTKDSVCDAMFGKKSEIRYTEQDVATVQSALAWFENTQQPDTDFFYNLTTLLTKNYIPVKMFGYVLALFPVYFKGIEEKESANKPSEFIGNVGDKKVSMKVVCKRIIPLVGAYGVSNMYIFKSGDNIVTYISASFKAEIGEVLNIQATIKDHSVYQNTKQTVITRAKIV